MAGSRGGGRGRGWARNGSARPSRRSVDPLWSSRQQLCPASRRRTPRARRGRRPARPRRRPAAGVMLSSSRRGAPAASASSISAASRTSTASGRSGRAARARRTASPTPPASAAWFSLIRMKSYRPARWLAPPPSATARFSSARRPGRRLARVEQLRGAAGGARSRARRVAVSVATPDSRPRKLSAVRSAVSSAPAAPVTRSTGAGGSRHSASGPSRSIAASGSSRRKTASATPSPEITPGAFCVIVATPRAVRGRRSPRRSRRRRRRPRPARGRSGPSIGHGDIGHADGHASPPRSQPRERPSRRRTPCAAAAVHAEVQLAPRGGAGSGRPRGARPAPAR